MGSHGCRMQFLEGRLVVGLTPQAADFVSLLAA